MAKLKRLDNLWALFISAICSHNQTLNKPKLYFQNYSSYKTMLQFPFQVNHYPMIWLHNKHILNHSKYEIQASGGREILCNQRSILAICVAVTAWVVKSGEMFPFDFFNWIYLLTTEVL